MQPRDLRRTVLIDTDTASDDAVVLIEALGSTEVELAGMLWWPAVWTWRKRHRTRCIRRICAERTGVFRAARLLTRELGRRTGMSPPAQPSVCDAYKTQE